MSAEEKEIILRWIKKRRAQLMRKREAQQWPDPRYVSAAAKLCAYNEFQTFITHSMPEEEESNITTGPKFGCVHWEAKTEAT